MFTARQKWDDQQVRTYGAVRHPLIAVLVFLLVAVGFIAVQVLRLAVIATGFVVVAVRSYRAQRA